MKDVGHGICDDVLRFWKIYVCRERGETNREATMHVYNRLLIITRGVQKNRITEKTDEKLTEKTEPGWKTD